MLLYMPSIVSIAAWNRNMKIAIKTLGCRVNQSEVYSCCAIKSEDISFGSFRGSS